MHLAVSSARFRRSTEGNLPAALCLFATMLSGCGPNLQDTVKHDVPLGMSRSALITYLESKHWSHHESEADGRVDVDVKNAGGWTAFFRSTCTAHFSFLFDHTETLFRIDSDQDCNGGSAR